MLRVVPQRENERLAFADGVRLVEIKEGLMITTRAAGDAPAFGEIVLDDIIDGIIGLRIVGAGLAELVRHAVGLENELAQDEVAATRSARPGHRQAGMRQGLEPNRGDDAGFRGDAVDGIGFDAVALAARQNGAIIEHVELGTLLGDYRLRINDAPAAVGFLFEIGKQLFDLRRRHFCWRRLFLHDRQLGVQLLQPFFLFRRRHRQLRLLHRIEERIELVIFLMADRIVFVRVTLGATDGQTEPGGAGGVGAIDGPLDAELLRIGAPFLVERRVAMETGGDNLRLVALGNISPASCSMVN